jgi:hypothetical protein
MDAEVPVVLVFLSSLIFVNPASILILASQVGGISGLVRDIATRNTGLHHPT